MVRLEFSVSFREIPCVDISIPKWYDWSFSVSFREIPCVDISIPKWYDWSSNNFLLVYICFKFQFLNGTIGV